MNPQCVCMWAQLFVQFHTLYKLLFVLFCFTIPIHATKVDAI